MALQKMAVDLEKIKMAIHSGIPLSITTYTLPREMETYMGDILSAFLTELDQQQMIQYLSYCLSELMTNAKKANTKRVYFAEKKLNIMDAGDYKAGMATFKADTLGNIDHYLQLQKEARLYVKLFLQARANKIKIEVHNNCPLTVFEYKRIHDKLARAQQYASMEEALSQILDDSEGAGLGLIIMILMLEKIGLTEENFQTVSENGETITRIILPVSEKTKKELSIVALEFIKTINDLPQFPDNIVRLNRLLNDPDSKMSDIAMQISNDATLTGELLKLVNSAAFALANPCSNIADAVKLVGIRGIRNLLYSIGSIKTFERVPGSKKELWAHAYQVAFYSYNMARNFCANERAVIDDAYICGLLHDMGKIIFETAHPDLLERVMTVCSNKGIAKETFEKLISGVNHGEIGARVAEKWNFPETISNVIRYHHEPEEAPENIRKLVSLVYLADATVHYQKGDIDFYQMDPAVLSLFKITSEAQLKSIADRLYIAFKRDRTN
ncbi:HDOD domain-containing protein [Treponema socranskii]|uniref:HDOD domain-containing protein n=1 Tax=Treponema socranskii TaxID=53419 RepID=UPI003D8AFAB4